MKDYQGDSTHRLGSAPRLRSNPPVNIFTAAEDLATGWHAERMLDRLAKELAPALIVKRDVWNFGLLRNPHLREFAANDAARADVVIISAKSESPLPVHVKDWAGRWVARRKNNPTALVALLAEGTISRRAPFCAFLRQTAEAGHMDFFCRVGGDHQHRLELAVARPETRKASTGDQILSPWTGAQRIAAGVASIGSGRLGASAQSLAWIIPWGEKRPKGQLP